MLPIALWGMLLVSCKGTKEVDEAFAKEKGTYFSIKRFILDEWTTHAGEPISFAKTVTENDKITDTGFVNVEHMDWPSILGTFVETNIGERSFLGQYSYTETPDSLDYTINMLYMANSKDLFTQKLLLTVDMRTMKLMGVFIETYRKTFWNEQRQRLYYAPATVIQIQQYDEPLIGKSKSKIIKYIAAGTR